MVGDEVDQSKMPLLDHLVELRSRLVYALSAFVVAFFISYYFAEPIFNFLVQPLADITKGEPNRRLIYTALHEAFFTYIKVAFFAAACLSFPVIAAQLWMFVAPGLYRHEKRAFLPFLVATPILFLIGASLVYFVVVPLAWQFFLSFEHPGGSGELPLMLEPKVDQYLSLIMQLIFAFGVCFELPVLITLLAKVGMATSSGLAAKRRYAIVIAFVVAAVLTPPDVISQVMLAVPIILLYEISIVCAKIVERQRGDAEADDLDEDDDEEAEKPAAG